MVGSRKTPENIEVFHTVLDIFGSKREECKVKSYWDETKENWIDIAMCPDRPFEQVISYATIGLSDFSIGKVVDEIQLGVEFVGACDQKYDKFPNIIAACAAKIILDCSSCFPGAIYPDVIEMYLPEIDMKHILFHPPYGWDQEFETLHFPTKKVAWLLAVPISEAEYQFSREKGVQALNTLFVENQIDIYNLERKSII